MTTVYRWSAGRLANYWPTAAGRYGVRLLLNGVRIDTIFRHTEAAAQSLIDWINRTDLGECPEWATLMPVASGADLKANDPEGEWGREGWVDEWLTDHHTAADDLRYPIRRTPAPAEPLTERVPLAECLGREVPWRNDSELAVLVGERACPIFAVDLSLGSYKADGGWVHHEMRCDADGTVEVLRRSTEDGKR